MDESSLTTCIFSLGRCGLGRGEQLRTILRGDPIRTRPQIGQRKEIRNSTGMEGEKESKIGDPLVHQRTFVRQKITRHGIDTTTKPIATPVGVHGGVSPRSCPCSIPTHRRSLTVATKRDTSTIARPQMTTQENADSPSTLTQPKEVQ